MFYTRNHLDRIFEFFFDWVESEVIGKSVSFDLQRFLFRQYGDPLFSLLGSEVFPQKTTLEPNCKLV